MTSRPQVLVVGAGVIGLSTARCLQATVPVDVTVLAEHFTPATTSDAAFGLWEPYRVGTDIDRVRLWGKETLKYLETLANSHEASVAGVYSVSGYVLHKQESKEPFWKEECKSYRLLLKEELESFNDHFSSGYFSTKMVAEGRYYLPWLMDKILSNGGKFINRKINSLDEVKNYDVVVNCTGVGAYHLVHDKHIKPVRGQVLRVQAPWIKHFKISDDDIIYILPGIDSVVLGGSGDEGVWDIKANADTRKRIWEGCCRLEPSLRKAKVLGEWVGLRPVRSTVRLEAEAIQTASGATCQVVHNYGHGGAGVTLHWGCALEAAQLVAQCLQASGKIKRPSNL